MFESLKLRSHRWIARKRRCQPVQVIHRLTSFLEDAYENVEWDLAVNGETALIRRLAPAGFTTAFDVGAHVGDWSIAALSAWPACHVHAFEVAPATFERLASRIGSAGFSSRVSLNGTGLSDAGGRREMYFYAEHPHLTGEKPWHTCYRATPFQADLVEGDAYVAERRIDAIDFIKVDVEGAEHRVLNGLRSAMEEGRLHCLQFEYGAFSLQTRVLLADYYEMLGARYWIGKVYPTHVEFSDYDWTMESIRFANFLCVARSRPDLKSLAEGS
jgi:FkbM family methyltransferase